MSQPNPQSTHASSIKRDVEVDASVGDLGIGERRTARALYDRYRDAIMGYCLLATEGDRGSAEEFTEEAFVEIFHGIDYANEPEQLDARVWTVVHGVCTEHYAQRSRHAELLDLFAVERGVLLARGDDEAQLRRIERVREVLETIDDESLAEMAWLKYTDPAHGTRSIADELNTPAGVVAAKLARFRHAITDRLEEKLRAIDWASPAPEASP